MTYYNGLGNVAKVLFFSYKHIHGPATSILSSMVKYCVELTCKIVYYMNLLNSPAVLKLN